MLYEVAIPSHKRSGKITEVTLPMLRRGNVPEDRVTVFVAPDEIPEYEESLKNFGFTGSLVPSVHTLCAQREFILRHYPADTPLLNINDDIRGVVRKADDRVLEAVGDVDALVSEGFDLAERCGVRLWGFYAATNAMFMGFGVTLGLTHIVGSMYGVFVDHTDDVAVHMDLKEDYERSLRYYLRDGAVLRLNYASPVTPYGKGAGGETGMRTLEMERDAVRYLLREFPGMVRINHKRKGRVPQVLLKERRKA